MANLVYIAGYRGLGSNTPFPVIDYSHQMIHEGKHFGAGDITDVAGINTVQDYSIVTANNNFRAHFFAQATVDGQSEVYLYEGATLTPSATVLTVYNSDRNSSEAATVVITKTPTDVVTGTAQLFATLATAGNRAGGTLRNEDELILKANTKYLFRVISKVATLRVAVRFSWYEQQV